MGNFAALQINPPRPIDLMEEYSKGLSLKRMMMQQRADEENQKMRALQIQEFGEAMKRRQAVNEVISRAGGDFHAALPEVAKVDPEYALELSTKLKQWENTNTDGRIKILHENKEKEEALGRLIAGVTDEATFRNATSEAKRLKLRPDVFIDGISAFGYEGAKHLLPGMLRNSESGRKVLEYQQNDLIKKAELDKKKAEATMAEQERDISPEFKQREAVKKERVQTPGVDIPYSPEVESQRNRTAAAGAARQVVPIQTVDADGNPVTKIVPRRAGDEYAAAPTADMRNKKEARERLVPAIDQLEGLSKKIINKKLSISQKVVSAARGLEAALANDPEYRTYQDARLALAGNLAVAQQGSRPSDADIMAIWLPLVPNVFKDTKDSADMKWKLIRVNSGLGAGQRAEPSPSGNDPFAKYGGVRR